jgi:hypothetical protein
VKTTDVRNFALAACALDGGIAVLGLTIVSLILGGAASAAAGLLMWRTWSQTGVQQSGRDPRERTVVTRWVPVPLLVAGIATVVVRGFGVGAVHGHHLAPYRGMAVTAAATAIALYLSSLTDWCYITPRLRGLGVVPALPCQTSTTATWRTLTRVWLAHRIAAYAMLRIGIVALLAFGFAAAHPRLSSFEDSVAVTVAAAVVLYFVNRIVTIGTLVSNPPIQVGDKVILAEEFGTGVLERPVYYVVDVAIEGVQLMELGGRDQPTSRLAETTHDRSLDLLEISRLLRNREQFEGCREKCCKANRYCPLEAGDPVTGA